MKNNIFRTISINLIVFCILFLLPSASLNAFRGIKKLIFLINTKSVYVDPRASYPVYENKEVAKEIFAELNFLETEYKSFLGWRRKKTFKKHTNIKGKYNARVSKGEKINNSIWFFGGSTIWGTGVSDNGTIPSIFNQKTGLKVYNFGESGWGARQSLNQLLNVISDGYIPSKVIFYDGVNDVFERCRIEYKDTAVHGQQRIISSALENQKNAFNYIASIALEPYLKIQNRYFSRVSTDSYSCHTDLEKSRDVAKYLVNDWYSAFLISKSVNSEFYAILQPTIFNNNYDYKYLKTGKSMLPLYKLQYESVYPKIIEEIKKKCLIKKEFCNSFFDGSNWIAEDSKLFIDFCHLNKKGNSIIVDKLREKILN